MKDLLCRYIGWLFRKVIGMRKAVVFLNWVYRRRRQDVGAPAFLSRSEIRFQILNYHRVLPWNEIFSIDTVTTDHFEKQVELLAKAFRVVSLPRLLQDVDDNALQPNTLCITFDDGYRDNYLYAYPILKKYGVPATIFLSTAAINNQVLLWHDVVLGSVAVSQLQQLHWPLNGNTTWDLCKPEQRAHLAFSLLDELKTLSPISRDREIAKLTEQLRVSSEELSEDMMLSWDEIAEMRQNNICFGCHTVTHPILSLLNDQQLVYEISESKRIIEERLGEPVNLFAYPNGKQTDYDDRTKEILRSAGFRCAVTTRWGMNTCADDPFEWRRARPWDSEINKFSFQLVTLRMS